jgi:3-hydroxyisobutyrate dehydrogenase
VGWIEKALSVLKSGAPGSPLLSAISARMVIRDYAVNFLLSLMTKDLLYAQNDAVHSNVDLKTAEGTEAI